MSHLKQQGCSSVHLKVDKTFHISPFCLILCISRTTKPWTSFTNWRNSGSFWSITFGSHFPLLSCWSHSSQCKWRSVCSTMRRKYKYKAMNGIWEQAEKTHFISTETNVIKGDHDRRVNGKYLNQSTCTRFNFSCTSHVDLYIIPLIAPSSFSWWANSTKTNVNGLTWIIGFINSARVHKFLNLNQHLYCKKFRTGNLTLWHKLA